MKRWIACLAVVVLAACQPGAETDPPFAVPAKPVEAAPEPTPDAQPAVYPEATGPVANFFRADVPESFQGRWAGAAAACSSADVLAIGAKTFASPGLSAVLGDVEVNESAGVIIDLIANGTFTVAGQASDGRAILRLSVDGSRLQVFVMGLPADAKLPVEMQRCR